MLYLSIAAVVVILAIAYKNELMSFLGKLKSRKKEVSTFRPAVNDSKDDSKFLIFVRVLFFTAVVFFIGGIIVEIIVDINKQQEDKHPLKEMVLTISDIKENSDNVCKYVKFSDGRTIKVDKNHNTEWWLSKKGDKVRKLIYANKDPEYTPVFESDIIKDNAEK